MTRAESICDELNRVGDVITAARDLVNDGQLINLAPLQNEINRICSGLDGLDAAAAAQVQPVLLGLIDDLDHLAHDMRVRQLGHEEQLRALTTHSGAATAYTAPRRGKSK